MKLRTSRSFAAVALGLALAGNAFAAGNGPCIEKPVILKAMIDRPDKEKSDMVKSMFDKAEVVKTTIQKPEFGKPLVDKAEIVRPEFDGCATPRRSVAGVPAEVNAGQAARSGFSPVQAGLAGAASPAVLQSCCGGGR